MAGDALLTAAQAARRLGVRRAFILRLIRQRRLTAVRLGGHGWRIEPQAIADYIAANRQPADALEAPPAVDDRQLALFDPAAALEDGAPRLSLADGAGALEAFHNQPEEPTNA